MLLALIEAEREVQQRTVPLEREPENGPYRGRAKVRVIKGPFTDAAPKQREWRPALNHRSNIGWMRREGSA
jgi:hypothetical protein